PTRERLRQQQRLQASAGIEARARSRAELGRSELKVVGCVTGQDVGQPGALADLEAPMTIEQQHAGLDELRLVIVDLSSEAHADIGPVLQAQPGQQPRAAVEARAIAAGSVRLTGR